MELSRAMKSRDTKEWCPLDRHLNWLMRARSRMTSVALQSPPERLRTVSNDNRDGRLKVAEARLRQSVSRDPKDSDAWFALAYLLDYLDRIPESIEAARGGFRGNELDPQSWYVVGVRELVAGNYGAARAELLEAVRLSSTDTDARFCLGVALARDGSIVEALEEFRRILDIDPDHPGARRSLRWWGR